MQSKTVAPLSGYNPSCKMCTGEGSPTGYSPHYSPLPACQPPVAAPWRSLLVLDPLEGRPARRAAEAALSSSCRGPHRRPRRAGHRPPARPLPRREQEAIALCPRPFSHVEVIKKQVVFHAPLTSAHAHMSSSYCSVREDVF